MITEKTIEMVRFTHCGMTLETLPHRTQVIRNLLDKASKPAKWRRPRFTEKRVFPQFEPGMTTAEYITEYHKINESRCGPGGNYNGVNLKATPYTTDLDRPAPMLDPTLPELWEDLDAEPDAP
jgi:hypothetical protein